jgi:signal transduction histidine kinase
MPERLTRWLNLSWWVEHLSRLRLLIVLAVALGLAIPGLLLARQEGVSVRTEAFTRLQEDLRRYTEVSAEGMRDPLWQVSPELGRAVAQAVFSDQRIASLMVLDAQQKKPFLSYSRPIDPGDDIIAMTREIHYLDRNIGSVKIIMSTESASKLARAAQTQILVRTLVGLVCSLLLIFIVMHWQLVKPIEYLKRMSSRLAQRDLSQPIGLRRNDELGQLAGSLESTRLALAGAFADLEEKNRLIAEHATDLEQRVTERTHELEASNTRLSETLGNLQRTQSELIEADRLASLGRMVAGIAHELNTPLGSSLTVASTLMDHYRSLSADVDQGNLRKAAFEGFMADIGEGLTIMQRNVQRAADMVDKFRQVAVDQTSEQRRIFKLHSFIDELQMTLSPRFKHTPIKLHLDIDADLQLDSYPGPLGQVLANLELNALIHAFDGRDEGNLRLSAKLTDDDMVRLSIKDDGVGMSEEIRQHIFDPFFTTRLGRGGSGLGLSIAYNIVTGLLGGKIWVVSEPGAGAEFIIEIPLRSPLRADKPREAQ